MSTPVRPFRPNDDAAATKRQEAKPPVPYIIIKTSRGGFFFLIPRETQTTEKGVRVTLFLFKMQIMLVIITKHDNKQISSKQLLEWYAHNGRELPWRFKGGAHPDPYVILVSELMLQQTTVKTVIPYFHRFMQRFPTVQALAEAPLEDVYPLLAGKD